MDLHQLLEINTALLAADAEAEAFAAEVKRLEMECIPTQATPRSSVRGQIAAARKIVDAEIVRAMPRATP